MKNWKSIVLLLLVFLTGLAVGVVGTRTAARHFVANAIQHPERFQLYVERDLNRNLQLDRDQRLQLHEILTVSRGQLRELRQQYQPQMARVISNANVEIIAILTPEQQIRFERFKEANLLRQQELRPVVPARPIGLQP